VLIVSSVTVALAIWATQIGRRKLTIVFLISTLVLATTFLVIKYFEYAHKFHVGQLPGKYYHYNGIEGTNPHIFFSVYFLMTGLHGIHVIAGMVVISWMLIRTVKKEFSPAYYTPLEMTGLYWHLVDLIWIFLFPLFYLIH
jgi:cytochrome c oxidase subunit 3